MRKLAELLVGRLRFIISTAAVMSPILFFPQNVGILRLILEYVPAAVFAYIAFVWILDATVSYAAFKYVVHFGKKLFPRDVRRKIRFHYFGGIGLWSLWGLLRAYIKLNSLKRDYFRAAMAASSEFPGITKRILSLVQRGDMKAVQEIQEIGSRMWGKISKKRESSSLRRQKILEESQCLGLAVEEADRLISAKGFAAAERYLEEQKTVKLARDKARDMGLQDRFEIVLVSHGSSSAINFLSMADSLARRAEPLGIVGEVINMAKVGEILLCEHMVRSEQEKQKREKYFESLEQRIRKLKPYSQPNLLGELSVLRIMEVNNRHFRKTLHDLEKDLEDAEAASRNK